MRLASTIDSASSIVGSAPTALVNSAKIVEPIPTITASTSTLIPEETTLPSTRSAMKAVLPNSPNGMSTNPHSVVSLNSIRVTNSWIERMKKATITVPHATSRITIWRKFSKKLTNPMRSEIAMISGWAASSPTCATRPGWSSSAAVKPVPLALSPSPAKLSKTIRARLFQLPIR